MTETELKSLDVRKGFERLGYEITASPVEGCETEFWQELSEALKKTEEQLAALNREFKTRGTSARSLALLHKWHSEPTWGVRPKISYDKR